MKIDLSVFNEEVQKGIKLCSQIEKYGYEAYIVGGCVRDIVRWYKNRTRGRSEYTRCRYSHQYADRRAI